MSNDTKQIGPVDVLETLAGWCNEHGIGKSEHGRRSATYAAVAELIEASERTIRAFEALGNANSVLPTRLAHMECESAMVAQKAALANVGRAS